MAGSIVLHAGLAMALVANGGGHGRAGASLPVASLELDIAPLESPALVAVADIPLPAKRDHDPDEHVPTHTHAYPVAPSHDAHAHDPSLHHDEIAPAPAPLVAPASAAPVADALPAALPTFIIPSGAGLPSSVRVSGPGAGEGRALSGGASTGSGTDDVIVPAAGVSVAAKLVSAMVAAYPPGARADEVEGNVDLEIVVDRDGRVIEARVARPAGHGFDDAALAAVRRYRFSPAQRDGRAVRVRMPWSVQFRLR